MSNVVESTGGDLTFYVARGSDCVVGIEIRDDNDDLRSVTTLLVWLDGVDSGFTWSMVEPGSFTVTLPRAVTVTLEPLTAYSIGYVDELELHQPLLAGQVRISHGRLGTGT